MKRVRSARPVRPGAGEAPGEKALQRESLFGKGKRWFISLFMTLPDPEKGWILPSALRAVREIRRNRIDCVLTTCPPHSVMLAGLLVKKLTKAGWIVDLRDPWSTVVRKAYPVSALSDWIEARLERAVFRNADLVVCTVERLRDVYRRKYADQAAEKFASIPNGIDAAALTRMPVYEKYTRFTLSYTGSLYYGRSPEPVFKAVRLLLDEHRVQLEDLCIRLVGQCRSVEGSPIEALISSYGLSGVVSVTDMVPRAKAFEIVARSHVALLFAPDQPYQIPGKVYDYLGVRTPILAIAQAGATADLVEATGCGRAFCPSDVAGISEFILGTMKGERGSEQDRADLIARFDAVRLTGDLVKHLEQIAPRTAAAQAG
jgi:glycosyltransferase involved in cell wall biosynthesis